MWPPPCILCRFGMLELIVLSTSFGKTFLFGALFQMEKKCDFYQKPFVVSTSVQIFTAKLMSWPKKGLAYAFFLY